MKDSLRRKFLMVWLCSGILVTGVRFFHAMPMSLDLAYQIQAAQNLLAGNGVSIYEHYALDLAAPGRLTPLTKFPAGYSFLTAALLGLGGSERITTRLLASAGTILGWWGWGILAYSFSREKINRGGAWKWAGFLIAVSTPLLFTVAWTGTDVFLWAALPWVVNWVAKASQEGTPGRTRYDLLAGAGCGVAILMRYSSVFLAAYAVCLIVWQTRLRPHALARRSFFFAALLPALIVQYYINHSIASGPANPGGLEFTFGFADTLGRALEGIPLLRTANFLWSFWFPGIAMQVLITSRLPWQLAINLAFYVFLAITIKTYGVDLKTAPRDSRVAAIGLFVVFPALLWVCMLLGPYDYLGNERYYRPLVPLALFVVFSFAPLYDIHDRTRFMRAIRTLGGIYVACYVVLTFAYIALFLAPGERGAIERDRLLAFEPAPWSMRFIHELSPVRTFVTTLVKEEPDTVLLASNKNAWFLGEPNLDRSRLHELSCDSSYLKASYVTGPARLVFLTFNLGEPQDLWSGAYGPGDSLRPEEAACFEDLPGLSLIQSFPEEGLKVLEVRVPAGTRVGLRH